MQSVFRKFEEIYIPVKNIFEVLGYFKSILWQASKPLTIILLILSLGGGLTLVAELWAITTLINKLIEHDPSNSNFAMTIKILLPWVLLFIGAMLIKHSFQAFQPYISKQLEERATSIVKDNIFKKSLKLDLRSFETEEYYNQLENAQQSINHRFTTALESVGFLIGSIVELIVIIAAISKSGILFAILLIAGSIPLIFLDIKASKEFVQVNYRQSPLKRHLNYWVSLSTSRNTAAELRLFGLGPYFLKKWKNLSDQLIDELYKVRKRVASLRVKGEIILIVLLSIIIVGTVYAGVKGTISVGVLVASLYMLNRFEQAISQVGGYGEALSDFYFRFQYVPKFLKSGIEEAARGFQSPKDIKHGIVFENVSFSYPGSSRPSLENIDLHIAAGERIAVVGENGAGKSTLALLLLGLYQPTKGRILIDGIDLKEINLVSWRAKAAAVFQNFVKYQLSAKDNITFGNIGVQDDELKLKQSASLSGIMMFSVSFHMVMRRF
ncbi:ABC transporter ATP-binding protein [Bacillus sp. FSL K6-3431]|uniref:ABC transporter ATP-binding protein n=1 Tax=Bacillus sp. FSL K6-3431 TaxID=2921500 RepID=UPI0030F7AD4E